MGWFTSTYESDAEYVGQDVDGANDAGCPFIGQTVETAVSDDSLSYVAYALGMSVEELRAQLSSLGGTSAIFAAAPPPSTI